VLEDFVLLYAKNIPNVQVLRARTPQKGGSYGFSGNPRRVVWFCRNERRLVDACAMGSSRPML
jgi:hypothetical protein